jgi:oligopeptide/dipeptide ABC transporter ATP-binding protein
LGVSYLFISHDLAVVHTIAHRVAVMYRGEIVEEGPGSDVLLRAAHPYTQLLVGSIPELLGTTDRLPLTPIQRLGAVPTACPFHPRCPHAMSRCAEESPPPAQIGGAPTHRVRCFAVTMDTPPMTWVAAREALSQSLASRR